MEFESVRIDFNREPADADNLRRVATEFEFDESVYRRALEIAGLTPESRSWSRLLGRFLMVYGVALIIAGVASFFAYNWDDLGKFAKFAMLETAVILCAVAAWYRGLDSLPGQLALFAAAFSVGLLLAVFGQTYQTGADPYSLFLGWALLVLGWAVIGRQPGLWLLMILLANLTLILYWEQVLNPVMGTAGEFSRVFGPLVWLFLMMSDYQLAQWVFAVNALALVVWELYAQRGIDWMQSRWLPRTVSMIALLAVVSATIILIFADLFEQAGSGLWMGGIGFVLFITASFWYYRTVRRDLFMLASSVLSLIVVITAFVSRGLGDDWVSGWLLLCVLVIGQTAAGAYWLRAVAQSWREVS